MHQVKLHQRVKLHRRVKLQQAAVHHLVEVRGKPGRVTQARAAEAREARSHVATWQRGDQKPHQQSESVEMDTDSVTALRKCDIAASVSKVSGSLPLKKKQILKSQQPTELPDLEYKSQNLTASTLGLQSRASGISQVTANVVQTNDSKLRAVQTNDKKIKAKTGLSK